MNILIQPALPSEIHIFPHTRLKFNYFGNCFNIRNFISMKRETVCQIMVLTKMETGKRMFH